MSPSTPILPDEYSLDSENEALMHRIDTLEKENNDLKLLLHHTNLKI
jgi:hypothetical protein